MNYLNYATATIHISDIYWFEENLFFSFDITFDNHSTKSFKDMIGQRDLGKDIKEASLNYDNILAVLKKAGIADGKKVAVGYSKNGKVSSIAAAGSDIWVDTKTYSTNRYKNIVFY